VLLWQSSTLQVCLRENLYEPDAFLYPAINSIGTKGVEFDKRQRTLRIPHEQAYVSMQNQSPNGFAWIYFLTELTKIRDQFFKTLRDYGITSSEMRLRRFKNTEKRLDNLPTINGTNDWIA